MIATIIVVKNTNHLAQINIYLILEQIFITNKFYSILKIIKIFSNDDILFFYLLEECT